MTKRAMMIVVAAMAAACGPEPGPTPKTCGWRAEVRLVPELSVPKIDAGTCVDLSPRVSIAPSIALPTEVYRGLSLSIEDRLLVYVPPADETGRRVVDLEAVTTCQDTCPAQVAGRPTEEKCPAPSEAACAVKLPGVDPTIATLTGTSLRSKKADGTMETLAYDGVVIVANEIRVGRIETNGRRIALLAETIVGKASGASISTVPLRAPAGRPAHEGGDVVIVAARIEGAPIGVTTDGGRGPLPRSSMTMPDGATVGVHWDCPDYGPTASLDAQANGAMVNPACFGCGITRGGGRPTGTPVYALDPQSATDPGRLRCLTGLDDRVEPRTTCGVTRDGIVSYAFFSYPVAPHAFPASFLQRAPSGNPGGAPGTVTIHAHETAVRVAFHRNPGRGSRGLGAYKLVRAAVGGGTDCWSADDSSHWDVPEGQDYSNTGSVRFEAREAGAPSSFGAEGVARVYRALEEASGELIAADVRLARAERAFRSGDREAARRLYDDTIAALGPWSIARGCPIEPAYQAALGRARAAITRLDAELDYAGLHPALVPYESDVVLATQVESAITAVGAEATRLQLMALLSMTAAQHEAKLAAYATEADGDLAARQSAVEVYAAREVSEKLAEARTAAKLADEQLTSLAARLQTYYQSKISATPAIGAAIEKVAKSGLELAGTLFKMGTGGGTGVPSVTFDSLFSAGKQAFETGKAVGELIGVLDQPSFDCSKDPTCVQYRAELNQARTRVDVASRAVAAAGAAVARRNAEHELTEARRAASRDLQRVLRNGTMVVPVERTARAARYVCEYGGQLVDDAARALHRYQRASALRDVPATAQDASLYRGAGGRYDYSFQPLFAGPCPAGGCSLRDDFLAFRAARLAHVPVNTMTLHAGTDVPAEAQRAATLLRAAPLSPGGRAELELGLLDVGGALRLAMRPPGAGAGAPIVDGTSFDDKWAVQVLSIRVRLASAAGPLRASLPLRVSRATSDTFTTESATSPRLAFTMAAYPNLATDGGRRVTEAVWNAGTGTYDLPIADLANPAAVLQHPESLLKAWTVWLPICASAGQGACATVAELESITAVEVQVAIRYKAR